MSTSAASVGSPASRQSEKPSSSRLESHSKSASPTEQRSNRSARSGTPAQHEGWVWSAIAHD